MIWASHPVPIQELEQEFSLKVKGEYKLFGASDGELQECYRCFLKVFGLQAKSYKISSKARNFFF